jgi:hypothetical protein
MENSDTIGNRTRDFMSCSAVPPPTAPPRAPSVTYYCRNPIGGTRWSPNEVRTVKYGRHRWARYVMRVRETRNALSIWIRKPHTYPPGAGVLE